MCETTCFIEAFMQQNRAQERRRAPDVLRIPACSRESSTSFAEGGPLESLNPVSQSPVTAVDSASFAEVNLLSAASLL